MCHFDHLTHGAHILLAIFSADRHKHCCEQKNNEGEKDKMVDKDVVKKVDNELDNGSGVLVSADPHNHCCEQ